MPRTAWAMRQIQWGFIPALLCLVAPDASAQDVPEVPPETHGVDLPAGTTNAMASEVGEAGPFLAADQLPQETSGEPMVASPAAESVSEEIAEFDDEPSRPFLGALFDVGLPDAVNVGVVYRPFHWLRVHAGPSYNVASFGLRGGVSLIPFDYWFSPSLVIEGGHFFDGDLSGTMENVLGVDASDVPDTLTYTYGNAHLGLEFGSPDFTFYVRGGFSLIDANLKPGEVDRNATFRFEDTVHLSVISPSAKLGFAIYFL